MTKSQFAKKSPKRWNYRLVLIETRSYLTIWELIETIRFYVIWYLHFGRIVKHIDIWTELLVADLVKLMKERGKQITNSQNMEHNQTSAHPHSISKMKKNEPKDTFRHQLRLPNHRQQ